MNIHNSQVGSEAHNQPRFIKGVWSDCIPMLVLKVLDILVEIFNMCLKESYFQDRWKA